MTKMTSDRGEWVVRHRGSLEMAEQKLRLFALNRWFCVTSKGRMGQVPRLAQIGDLICVFEGGKVPFVLRRKGEGTLSLAGECDVHGIMHGEAVMRKMCLFENLL
jgi:hypothetical protein